LKVARKGARGYFFVVFTIVGAREERERVGKGEGF
jgi:hypothetical protein